MQHHLIWTSIIVSAVATLSGLVGLITTAVFTFRQRKQLVRAEKRWLAHKLHSHEIKSASAPAEHEEPHAELVL